MAPAFASTVAELERQLQSEAPHSEFQLTPESLAHWVLLRHPELKISQAALEIAEQRIRRQRGVYQPQVFMTLGRSGSERPNSPERPDTPILKDETTSGQLGVRTLINTGAEVSLTLDASERSSNSSSADDPIGIDDIVANLRLELRQPLLQGRGAVVAKRRIEQAITQRSIARQELHQQQLMKSFEAVNLYWNLYRTEQIMQMTELSVENARQLVADTDRLVLAGRLPQTALAEAYAGALLREADLESARQQRAQVQAEIRRMLNLNPVQGTPWQFMPTASVVAEKRHEPDDFEAYLQQVLSIWPNYQIAQAQMAISEQSLRIAQDQRQSRLDLVLSYGQNGRSFDHRLGDALSDTFSNDFPDWRVALEWSMPLGPNRIGRADEAIARAEQLQAQQQLDIARVTVANQLRQRIDQVQSTWEEWQFYQANVSALMEVLEAERAAFARGQNLVRQLIEREEQMNAARVRAINSQVRFQLSKVSLSLSDGSLLTELGLQEGSRINVE